MLIWLLGVLALTATQRQTNPYIKLFLVQNSLLSNFTYCVKFSSRSTHNYAKIVIKTVRFKLQLQPNRSLYQILSFKQSSLLCDFTYCAFVLNLQITMITSFALTNEIVLVDFTFLFFSKIFNSLTKYHQPASFLNDFEII